MSKKIKHNKIRPGDRIRIIRDVTVDEVDRDGDEVGVYSDELPGGEIWLGKGAVVKLLERKPSIPEDAQFITWVHSPTGVRMYAERIDGGSWVEDGNVPHGSDEGMLGSIGGAEFQVLEVTE